MNTGKKAGWGTVLFVLALIVVKVAIRVPRMLQRAEAARTSQPTTGSTPRISVSPHNPQPSASPSDDGKTPLLATEHFIRKQRWADAMIGLDALRTSHANDAQYWLLVGEYNERGVGNYAAAEEAYRKAITLDPKSERANDLLATMLSDRGRQADAMAVYRQLAQQLPQDPHPYRAAARLATKAGSHAQALTLQEKAFGVIAHPVATDYVARGQARAMANKDEEAMADFLASLKLDPRLIPARFGVADLHLKNRRLDQAKAAYEALLADDPQLGRAYLQLGRIAQMQGDTTSARRYWTRATTLDPRGDASRAARRHLAELDAARAGVTKSR